MTDDARAQPLTLAVHGLPSPEAALQSADRRTRLGRIKMLLVLLACAAPVIASYFTYHVIRPQARTHHGQLIQPPRELPGAAELPLQDLKGRAVDPRTLKDQWLLVVVADGACDAVCERLLYAQRQLRESLGREKDRLDRVWLVTGEAPPRANLLPALAGAQVLSAPREALGRRLRPDEGQPLSAHLYLVDPMGMWMMRLPADFEPAKAKRDLDRLLRASSSWDRAGRDPAIVGDGAAR